MALMARYARVFSTIWSDDDFKAIDGAAQRLYLLLISQPDISHAGVVPLTERRWARLAADTTPVDISAALARLAEHRFVVIDDATEELWVRSYIRHDRQYVSPNGRTAVHRACSEVLSPELRQLIGAALSALLEAPPEGAAEPPQEGDASPQQPAASSRDPAASSRVPAEPPAELNSADPTIRRRLESITERFLTREAETTTVHNATGWRKAVRTRFLAEHAATLTRWLALFPTAPDDVLLGALDTGDTRNLAYYRRPTDDHTDPLASIHELHPPQETA